MAATLQRPELDVKWLDPYAEMMMARGFIQDEGLLNACACMLRGVSRAAYIRKMAWLMPRTSTAVPYLGYILVGGVKPAG